MVWAARANPFLLPLLSGLLLYLSFPPADWGFLAWVALVPLLAAIRDSPPRSAFQAGVLCGISFYLPSLYWVTHALVVYGGLSRILSLLVLVALCLYLSAYFGFFSWLASHFRMLPRGSASLWLSCLWVSLEYLRNWLLSGFPWNLLGYSQHRFLTLLQLTSLTGIYGLSFLLLVVNISLFQILRPPFPPSARRLGLVWAIIAILLALAYGSWRLHHRLEGRPLRVAVIQGNIDQSLKWEPSLQRQSFETHRQLTLGVSGFRPDLVVWPETALPLYLRSEKAYRDELQALAQRLGSYLLVGAPDFEGEGGVRYYNSAFFFTPCPKPPEKYDKMHLVPFGEYVPLRGLLFFVEKLVPGMGDFTAGKEPKIFPLSGGGFGVLICFEAIFPELARTYRSRGANFLVNITNDAWFGKTAAPYQHLAMAKVRAVENGVYLVRAANTGISALVSPEGMVLRSSPLFTQDRIVGIIKMVERKTVYARAGDLFAWLCLTLVGGRIVYTPISWRRSSAGKDKVSGRS